MDRSAKILLLGRTGVGKSAFINYYLGKNVAESAPGKPVTQDYFIPYEIEDGRYPVKIFDTKGLETFDANNQLTHIIKGIKERNNNDDIFNWFHTIFYCVSMANKFEKFEADFIRKLQLELTQHIHIILTHCDTCKPDSIKRMKERIAELLGTLNNNIEIFEVVCVSKKKRNGTEVQQYGREAVSERVFDLLLEDIAYKVSCSYAQSLRTAMIDGAKFAFSKAQKFIDGIVNIITLIEYIQNEDETVKRVNTYADEIEKDIENAINDTNHQFEQILQPVVQLYVSYWSAVTDSFVEDAQLNFENFVDFNEIFDEKMFYKSLMPYMLKNGYMDEEGDFIDIDSDEPIEIIKAILTGIRDLLSLNKNVKKFCKNTYDNFVKSIPSESELQQVTYDRIVKFIKRRVGIEKSKE